MSKITNTNVLELSGKNYQSNCTIFAYDQGVLVGTLNICFDGGDDFTTDENIAGIKETILSKFENADRESLDKVLSSIRICIDAISK